MNLWCLRIAYYITYTKKPEAAKVESGVTKFNVSFWRRLLNFWVLLTRVANGGSHGGNPDD